MWQFASARNDVINHADRDWIDATHRPAGRQMIHLRRLIESRPFFDRIPDQSLIASPVGDGAMHLRATRDLAGTYAFVYFPQGDQRATIDLARLKATRLRAWWYRPAYRHRHVAGQWTAGSRASSPPRPTGRTGCW